MSNPPNITTTVNVSIKPPKCPYELGYASMRYKYSPSCKETLNMIEYDIERCRRIREEVGNDALIPEVYLCLKELEKFRDNVREELNYPAE